MSCDESTESESQPSKWMVRSWSRRYLLVLAIVAALVVIDQAMIQRMLVGLSVYAPKINLAGRQRMLSQKVVKEGLALGRVGVDAFEEDGFGIGHGLILGEKGKRKKNYWPSGGWAPTFRLAGILKSSNLSGLAGL